MFNESAITMEYAAIAKDTNLSVDRCKTFCNLLFGESVAVPTDQAVNHIRGVKQIVSDKNLPLPEAVKLYVQTQRKKDKSKDKKGSVGDLVEGDKAIAVKIATTRYITIVKESDHLLSKFLTEGIPESYLADLESSLDQSQSNLKSDVFDVIEGEWLWVDTELPTGSDLLQLALPQSLEQSPGIG